MCEFNNLLISQCEKVSNEDKQNNSLLQYLLCFIFVNKCVHTFKLARIFFLVFIQKISSHLTKYMDTNSTFLTV